MFKYLTGLITLALAACSTAPVIVPDTTKDNVILKRLEWEIQNGRVPGVSWSWVLWYLPVVFLVVMWAYNQYLKKKCKEEEASVKNSEQDISKPELKP